jgi:ribosomal protein S18 acetylase RimI-like enzyme
MTSYKIEVCSKKHDLKRIQAVINAAYKKHRYLQRERISLEELKTILSHPKQRLYLCLSAENKICGTLLLDLTHFDRGELYLFSVDPSCQGQKLGALLLDHVEKEAFEKFHLKKIVLGVVKFLERLISYYSSLGYEPIGEEEFPDKNMVMPEYRDQISCLLMEKKMIS